MRAVAVAVAVAPLRVEGFSEIVGASDEAFVMGAKVALGAEDVATGTAPGVTAMGSRSTPVPDVSGVATGVAPGVTGIKTGCCARCDEYRVPPPQAAKLIMHNISKTVRIIPRALLCHGRRLVWRTELLK